MRKDSFAVYVQGLGEDYEACDEKKEHNTNGVVEGLMLSSEINHESQT